MTTALYFKSFTLAYDILKRLDAGEYGAQIGRDLNVSKQAIQHYINRFSRYGLIEQEFRGVYIAWNLTPSGKDFLHISRKKSDRSKRLSIGTMKALLPKTTRLHALNIKFPIVKDNDKITWTKETEITNWIQKSKPADWDDRIKISLVKKTKCVIACFHSIKTTQPLFLSDFMAQVVQGTFYVYSYLLKGGITVDPFNAKIVSQHIANESPEYENGVEKSVMVSKNLNRKVNGPFPSDLAAKAWLERSTGVIDIETNDLLYEEKLLDMPETLHDLKTDLIPVIANFSKNIKLHLEVERQTLKTLKSMEEMFTKYPRVNGEQRGV